MRTAQTTIVVPCYNEARRLPAAAYEAFAAEHREVRFILVNDGSTDDTALLLGQLAAAAPEQFLVIERSRNGGKASAVRIGMLRAMAGSGRYAGYWDADLATPLREIPRLIEVLEAHPDREVCFGSRVRLLGRLIERRAVRHYAGRVFATAASLALQLPIYDTQCGAKLFRVSSETRELFAEPFLGRWTFDVELVARLAAMRRDAGLPGPSTVIYELPLNEWRDVGSSTVRMTDFMIALVEVARIRRKYADGRWRSGPSDAAVRSAGR